MPQSPGNKFQISLHEAAGRASEKYAERAGTMKSTGIWSNPFPVSVSMVSKGPCAGLSDVNVTLFIGLLSGLLILLQEGK